jgi:hypothetical protein
MDLENELVLVRWPHNDRRVYLAMLQKLRGRRPPKVDVCSASRVREVVFVFRERTEIKISRPANLGTTVEIPSDRKRVLPQGWIIALESQSKVYCERQNAVFGCGSVCTGADNFARSETFVSRFSAAQPFLCHASV